MEKQGITEERVQVEDGCGSNSTCNAVTDEGQLVKVDLNNNLIQEDGTFSSSVQSEFLVKREDDSSTLNSDNAKAEVFLQNSSSVGEQGQMPNQLETVVNGIVLSSLSLQNPVESYVSTGHDKSLNKNNQIDEGGSYQGLVAIESFSDGKVIVNTRVKLEEKFGEICNQIGNAVASLEDQDQKEFLRMKLHELVDEIVGTNKNRLYKCEKCTSQVSNNCSKLLTLGTCVHKKIDERNSKSPNFQTEVPCEGSNIVDGFKEDKSFDNCSSVSSRCHIERAAAPCKKYENGYRHGTFCGDIRCNLCMCQSSDLHDRFIDGKEEPGRDMLLKNTMHNSSSHRQISNLQVPLGNVKVDLTKNLQCKSLPVLQSDVSSEEFHLKLNA